LLDLSRRDADVAVRAVYQTPSEGLAGEKLTDLAWAVFGPSTMASRPFDLASAGKERDWVALLDHVAVSRMGGWYKQNVDKTRIICRTNSIAGLVEAVAAGMGLALLPTYIADTIPGLTQLTPPLPELMGELWVLTHPDLYNSARVRTFFDFCAAELDRDRAIVVTAGSLQTESRLTEDKRRRTA
jgi:DNA-binding transcriptional LysR family regulator